MSEPNSPSPSHHKRRSTDPGDLDGLDPPRSATSTSTQPDGSFAGPGFDGPASKGDAASIADAPQRRKRQRVRLSCRTCRARKLSCDRNYPCDRCVKSGTAATCSFEAAPGTLPTNTGVPVGFTLLDPRRSVGGVDVEAAVAAAAASSERIAKLEQDLRELKALLARHVHASAEVPVTGGAETCPNNSQPSLAANVANVANVDGKVVLSVRPTTLVDADGLEACPPPREEACQDELRFFRGKEFRTRYYGPHNAAMAFSELLGLIPNMKEAKEEWLRPIFLCDRKDRRKGHIDREASFGRRDAYLETLLPHRDEVDALVSLYLDQFEQTHRIIHIPSFRRQYAKFWGADPQHGRYATFTALLLAICGISSCVLGDGGSSHDGHDGPRSAPATPSYVGAVSRSRHSAQKWIKAVENWAGAQSQKHRRLIHYQIACLLYIGKRVNTIKKKRFWTGAGALLQDAIAVGLHRDPGHMTGRISIFNQEMRRRIWATVQELDLQTSFDNGLPTLVSSLHFDSEPPRNLNDDEFDEDTAGLPSSRPVREYTFTAFQHVARQSLPLRLGLSRILSGAPGKINYEQVVQYTNDVSHAIDNLPSWEASDVNTTGAKRPLIAYSLLHIQLRQYLVPLHQPFIKPRRDHPQYQYSQLIYHNAARDIIQLHDKLYQMGLRALNFLREDSLMAAMCLSSVTMLQSRGSTNMISINSQHTLNLLEKCLAMKEDRLLRSGNSEPWGYCIMCNAIGLLEVHLGTKASSEAKAWAINRYVDLHKRIFPGSNIPTPLTLAKELATPPLPYDTRSRYDAGLASGAGAGAAPTWPERAKAPSTPAAMGMPNLGGVIDMRLPDPTLGMTPFMAVAMGGQTPVFAETGLAAPDFDSWENIAQEFWDDNIFLT